MECSHPSAHFKSLIQTSDYITGDPFAVGFCARCNLYVTAPVPPQDQLARFYPPGYYGTSNRFNPLVEKLLGGLYNFRVRYIKRRDKPGKVLDIGCGRGLLLHRLRARGWDVVGTEMSETSAAYARDVLRLPVLVEPLEEIGFLSGEFDLVMLWHVLEHVRDPHAMLQEVSRVLKPGGTLLLAVPNFASWEARWSGESWFHMDVPRHLNHFTPNTLGQALDLAGMSLEDAHFFSSEYDFYSFVQSAQNKMGLPCNLLYDLLRTRSAKVLAGRSKAAGTQVALALLSAVPLCILSLLYAPILAALGKGATMAVYAVKRQVTE